MGGGVSLIVFLSPKLVKSQSPIFGGKGALTYISGGGSFFVVDPESKELTVVQDVASHRQRMF